ncbi:MAG: tetratricopeptide repeat protein [Deltaproteobacteria bacterium]|nr:MAG: tetratricopeptide repeat protein [Deltaproteobacteria bacterium]
MLLLAKKITAVSVSFIIIITGLASLSGCASSNYVNGLILKDQKEYEQALQKFERINNNHPIYPRAQKEIKELSPKVRAIKKAMEKGERAFSKRYWQSAKRHFLQVLKIQPNHQEAKARLEQIEAFLKPRASLEDSLGEVENLFKQRELYLAQKKVQEFLRKNTKSQKAKTLSDQISAEIKRAESEVALLLSKGEKFRQEGDFLNAFLEWQKASELLPEDGRAQESLNGIEGETELALKENLKTAQKYYDENKLAQVETLLEKNLKVKPDDKPSQELLLKTVSGIALRYYNQNDYPQAIKYWEKALRYDPENQHIQKYIKKAQSLQTELEKIE